MTPQPPEMTQWQALRRVGWVQSSDFVFLGLLAASWVTVFFWWLFGSPTAAGLAVVAIGNLAVAQVWTISLIFRCSFFVLQMRAEINTMPAAAAKLALSFQRGSAPPA